MRNQLYSTKYGYVKVYQTGDGILDLFKKLLITIILKKAGYSMMKGAANVAGRKLASRLIDKALPKKIQPKLQPETVLAIEQNARKHVMKDLGVLDIDDEYYTQGRGVRNISSIKKKQKAILKDLNMFK